MVYQFVHLETYARKADRHGRSTTWVLDEAERREGSCPHVADPLPAEVVHGITLTDVRRLHDNAVAAHVVTLKSDRTRALRSDQKTLVTVVASHPATMEEVKANPSVAADVAAWEHRTVAWLSGKYGDRLLSCVCRRKRKVLPSRHRYFSIARPLVGGAVWGYSRYGKSR